jgi:dienelactone hydrolase
MRRAVVGPDTVVVHSGTLSLRGLVWRPQGAGPFPAVLFNHDSGHASGKAADGSPDERHPEVLGPVFARHGYVFLYLYQHKDKAVTRPSLIEDVWGWKQTGSNVIEAVVRSLRKKLGSRASAIETIRGSGYRFRSVGL